MTNDTANPGTPHPQPPARDLAQWLHLIVGLVALPFLIVSIVLAVALTHTTALHALSSAIYPSLPIPNASPSTPVQPGSWDQALALAGAAHGAPAHFISERGPHIVEVSAFATHDHDPNVQTVNPRTAYLIDTDTMRIVRVEDRSTSLFKQGHDIHAYRFFGIEWLSVSMVSSVALLLLLASGVWMARRDRRAGLVHTAGARRHLRVGQVLAVFIILISLTTLDFEFLVFNRGGDASHPIPPVALDEPIRAGSIDQARELAARAIGVAPRAAYLRGEGRLKLSEAGDGIGGSSVWVDGEHMRIERITDWRNDRQALSFILHDGRWLGGMNAFNIHDAAALGLLYLTISGVWLAWRRGRASPQP